MSILGKIFSRKKSTKNIDIKAMQEENNASVVERSNVEESNVEEIKLEESKIEKSKEEAKIICENGKDYIESLGLKLEELYSIFQEIGVIEKETIIQLIQNEELNYKFECITDNENMNFEISLTTSWPKGNVSITIVKENREMFYLIIRNDEQLNVDKVNIKNTFSNENVKLETYYYYKSCGILCLLQVDEIHSLRIDINLLKYENMNWDFFESELEEYLIKLGKSLNSENSLNMESIYENITKILELSEEDISNCLIFEIAYKVNDEILGKIHFNKGKMLDFAIWENDESIQHLRDGEIKYILPGKITIESVNEGNNYQIFASDEYLSNTLNFTEKFLPDVKRKASELSVVVDAGTLKEFFENRSSKVFCANKEIKNFINRWVNYYGWKFRDLSSFFESAGLKLPIEIVELDEITRFLKGVTADKQEIEIYLTFWNECQFQIKQDDVLKTYRVNEITQEDKKISEVYLWLKEKKGKKLKLFVKADTEKACLIELKKGNTQEIKILIEDVNNVYEKYHYINSIDNVFENYLLGLGSSIAKAEVLKELKKTLPEEEFSKCNITITSNKSQYDSYIEFEQGILKEYHLFEDGEHFYARKNSEWKYDSTKNSIVITRTGKSDIDVQGSEADRDGTEFVQLIERIEEMASKMRESLNLSF